MRSTLRARSTRAPRDGALRVGLALALIATVASAAPEPCSTQEAEGRIGTPAGIYYFDLDACPDGACPTAVSVHREENRIPGLQRCDAANPCEGRCFGDWPVFRSPGA